MKELTVYHDFTGLREWATIARNSKNSGIHNKSVLYESAIAHFENCQLESTYRVKQLENLRAFKLTPANKPKYFYEPFANLTIKIDSTDQHYNYLPSASSSHREYWVDFANRCLGGSALNSAFVQEEKIAAEIPELANHIANTCNQNGFSKIRTRNGGPEVQQGIPTPIVFENIAHVQNIEGIYGGKALSQVANIGEKIAYPEPRKVNILAMAAPKVLVKSESYKLATIEDLFNTALAGFYSCKEACGDSEQRILIHTGPFGAGSFNNDARVVYVVQKLAAEHLGIDLLFHGYSEKKVLESEEAYQAIKERFSSEKDPTIHRLLLTVSEVMTTKFAAASAPFL